MIVARAEGGVHIGTDDSNAHPDFVVSTDENARVDFRMRSRILAGLSLCALVGTEPVEAQNSESILPLEVVVTNPPQLSRAAIRIARFCAITNNVAVIRSSATVAALPR